MQNSNEPPSFRGDAKHRTRNLEIPGLVLTHHPGMTEYGFLKRTDRKIPQPQIGVAAFFPDAEQRPVQRLPQQVVALAHADADALAEIAALDKRPAREPAAFAGIGAVDPQSHRDRDTDNEADLAATERR